MTAFGGIFAGPTLSLWYRYVDQRVQVKSAFQGLMIKVGLDQFLFAPFFIAGKQEDQVIIARKLTSF